MGLFDAPPPTPSRKGRGTLIRSDHPGKTEKYMTKVAVLDDWQGVAKTSADWTPLQTRAEVVFLAQAFENEDDAARQLADFDIVLSMRERTPLPASLINRLP